METRMVVPAGESLVRKPEPVPRRLGMRGAMEGRPGAEVYLAI